MSLRTQRGASLTEILIMILIVSIALLGIAGVLSIGLKGTHASQGRSQASLLAADIIDRMRANRLAAQSTNLPYNIALTDATPAGATVPAQDLRAWRTALQSKLPSGSGAVTIANDGTWKVTVTVQWDESSAGGSSKQTFIVETRL